MPENIQVSHDTLLLKKQKVKDNFPHPETQWIYGTSPILLLTNDNASHFCFPEYFMVPTLDWADLTPQVNLFLKTPPWKGLEHIITSEQAGKHVIKHKLQITFRTIYAI